MAQVIFTSNLKKVKSEMRGAAKAALNDVTSDLLRRSVDRAPIDTGDLRGSGANEVRENGAKIEGMVGFNTEYALRQHEDLTLNHPEGEAKFLERPYVENRQKYQDHIREKLKRDFDR